MEGDMILLAFTEEELKTLREILKNSTMMGSKYYNLKTNTISRIDAKLLQRVLRAN